MEDPEFPADWEEDIPPEDGGQLGHHGVYGDEDEMEPEMEDGDLEGMEFEDLELELNQDDQLDYEEFDAEQAQPLDEEVAEFEEVAEELEDEFEAEGQAEAETNGGHPWNSPKSKSSPKKRGRGGRKLQEKRWRLEQKKLKEQRAERSGYQRWSENKSEHKESSNKWSKNWKTWGKWGKSKAEKKDQKDSSWWSTEGKSKAEKKDQKDSSWWSTQGKSQKAEKQEESWWSTSESTQVEAGAGSAVSRPRNLHKERKFDQASDSHEDWQQGGRQVHLDPSKVVHPWRVEASQSSQAAKGHNKGKQLVPQKLLAPKGLQAPVAVPPRGLQAPVAVPPRGLQAPVAVPPRGNTPRGFQPRPGGAGRRPVPVNMPPPPQGRQPVSARPPQSGNTPRGFQPRPGGNLPRALQGVQTPRLGGRPVVPPPPPVRGAAGPDTSRNETVHGTAASPKRSREPAPVAGQGAASAGAKRFKAEPQAPEVQPQEEQEEPSAASKSAKMKVTLKPGAAEKLKQLASRGVKLTPEALRSLADAEPKEAEILLQALLSRGEVPNPSRFVIASLANLAKRKENMVMEAAMEASEEQTPSVQSAPAPAARRPPRPPTPPPVPPTAAQLSRVAGQGQRPRLRNNLPFERLAVQAKLFALNQQGIWSKQGKALDESALSALMRIVPDRGLEILDEVEAQGVGLADPSRYARELANDEEKVFPPC